MALAQVRGPLRCSLRALASSVGAAGVEGLTEAVPLGVESTGAKVRAFADLEPDLLIFLQEKHQVPG